MVPLGKTHHSEKGQVEVECSHEWKKKKKSQRLSGAWKWFDLSANAGSEPAVSELGSENVMQTDIGRVITKDYKIHTVCWLN